MNKVYIESNKRIILCVDDEQRIDLTDNNGQVNLKNIKLFLGLNLNTSNINYEEINEIYREGVKFFINSLLEINQKEEDDFIELELEDDVLPF